MIKNIRGHLPDLLQKEEKLLHFVTCHTVTLAFLKSCEPHIKVNKTSVSALKHVKKGYLCETIFHIHILQHFWPSFLVTLWLFKQTKFVSILNQSKCLGFFFLVWKSFLLLNIPSVDLEIMSKLNSPMSGAERMRKHREENQLRTGLSHLKQQMKRSQLLASGTPEGDEMKKNARERKRLQRQRQKESAAEKGD